MTNQAVKMREAIAEAGEAGTAVLPSGLDRWEDSTLMCAVVHYALTVADPGECVRIMERFWPRIDGEPWDAYIAESRAKLRGIYDGAEAEGGTRP